jgi:DNA invertase Pin-like site-specific DNA recombinase
MISARTKAGLAAARARGVKLGNPALAVAQHEAATARDAYLRPFLEPLKGRSLREIAKALTDAGIATPRGNTVWGAMTVMRVMKRLGLEGEAGGAA